MSTDFDIELKEDVFKLSLARDLILYLYSIISFNMNKEQTIDLVQQSLKIWTGSYKAQLAERKKETMSQLMNSGMFDDTPIDVMNILMDSHSVLPDTVQREFCNEIEDLLQRIVESKEE